MSQDKKDNNTFYKEIEKSFPQEIRLIKKYNPISVIPFLSGLIAEPKYHCNAIRFEILIQFLLKYCNGRKICSRKFLDFIINDFSNKIGLTSMEDPNEDVFITNLIMHGGNYSLLRGNWNSPEFYLQQTFDVLNNFFRNEYILHDISPLLEISNYIAIRAGLNRYISGGGEAQSQILIPNDNQLKKIRRNVICNLNELKQLKLPFKALEPFILNINSDLENISDDFGSHIINKKPLIRKNDKLIVMLPTSIHVAINHHVFKRLQNINRIDEFEHHFKKRQTAVLFNNMIRPLIEKPVQFKFPNLSKKSLPDFDQHIFEFDEGKYVHLIILHDDAESFMEEGAQGYINLGQELLLRFTRYLNKVALKISKQNDYTGGLTVLIIGGWGRGIALPISKFPNKWYQSTYSISDLNCLSMDIKPSLLDIWKLQSHVHSLHKNGIEFFNIIGSFNKYSYCK